MHLDHPVDLGLTHGRIISAAIAGWFALQIILPMSWHSDATTMSRPAPPRSAIGRGLQAVLRVATPKPLHQRSHRPQHAEDAVGDVGEILVEVRLDVAMYSSLNSDMRGPIGPRKSECRWLVMCLLP